MGKAERLTCHKAWTAVSSGFQFPSLYIDLCNCLILICSIQHQMKVNLSSRQPGGCGLSWPGITVIKNDNVIVFQVVIWPVQLNYRKRSKKPPFIPCINQCHPV
ncbi:hypothetical protein AW086_26850 [Escherichia coli]|nr:hypothetical protein AW078_26600 [Escherichia coli]OTC81098.1 hypothetical protein AW086_26850 [Escherichia coli]OTD65877.1 hypothetical protein AW103_26980 [Escherichia coli]